MALIKIRDGISPDLRRRAAAVADKRPLLAAMGERVKDLGREAFTDPAKRPAAWAPRQKEPKDAHPLLQDKHNLRDGLRVISISNDSVIIGSQTPYAATHQLGSSKLNIPARPFLPFYPGGQMTPLGKVGVERVLLATLRARGL